MAKIDPFSLLQKKSEGGKVSFQDSLTHTPSNSEKREKLVLSQPQPAHKKTAEELRSLYKETSSPLMQLDEFEIEPRPMAIALE